MYISGLIVGLLLGFLLQRGQFCLSGQLRNIIFKRDLASMSPLLIAISVQSVGYFILTTMNVIHLPSSPMPILATISGAFLFGVGMAVANRCVSGQMYRAGEGMIAAWVTLIVFALTMAATQTGFLKFWLADMLQTNSQLVTFPQSLGISSLWLIVPLCVFSLFACCKSAPRENTPFLPKSPLRQFWSPHFTGLLLGVLAVTAWILSEQTGRNFGFSFSIPLGNVVQYVVTGQQRYLNWGTYLVFGVILGSLVSALLSGTLQWKSLSPADYGKSVSGGILMGIGATLTGGCTMANVVVGTAYFSWQAWVATFVMMFGAWCVFRLKKDPLEKVC
ncbi:YeeE/YedE family protein [Pasteurellaceae bacterium LIM206]|nr:YeeE/YedE family protein [Pasteurellaceae bacterium LIM206]